MKPLSLRNICMTIRVRYSAELGVTAESESLVGAIEGMAGGRAGQQTNSQVKMLESGSQGDGGETSIDRSGADPHWLPGGKLDGLTVPASVIRTYDMVARKDHAPSHLFSKSRLFCFERSGRT